MKVKDLPFTPEQISQYMGVTGYRLLILPDEIEEVSEGGIVIHTEYEGSGEMERAHQSTGTVVAIGGMAWMGIRGYDYEKYGPWCKVGDHVKYTKYSGKFVSDPIIRDHNEKSGYVKYALVNDEDIQSVIDDELIASLKKEIEV